MNIQVTKSDRGSLVPVDDEGVEVLSKIPVGEVFTVDVQRVRNPKMNALYWHLMGEILDNSMGQYGKTRDQVSDHILRAVGHTDNEGKVLSISFKELGQSEWEQVWNRVCDWIALAWDTDDEQLQRHIEELTGQVTK